jgi:uncharacterized radical SAM superfamily protein
MKGVKIMNYIGDKNIREQFYELVSQINDSEEFIKANYLFARHDNVREEIIKGIKDGDIQKEKDIIKITIKQSPTYKAGMTDLSFLDNDLSTND